VEGRLQIRNFDAKDGTKHWVTEVIANSVEFIERKAEGSAGRPPHAKMDTDGLGEEVPF
jgi:single-strand DNA-binding protein